MDSRKWIKKNLKKFLSYNFLSKIKPSAWLRPQITPNTTTTGYNPYFEALKKILALFVLFLGTSICFYFLNSRQAFLKKKLEYLGENEHLARKRSKENPPKIDFITPCLFKRELFRNSIYLWFFGAENKISSFKKKHKDHTMWGRPGEGVKQANTSVIFTIIFSSPIFINISFFWIAKRPGEKFFSPANPLHLFVQSRD